MSRLSLQRAAFYLFIAFVTLTFGYIFIETPVSMDDNWYLTHIESNPKYSTDIWQGIKSCIDWHYSYDNARICNMLATIALTLPQVPVMLITALIFAIGFLMMMKLSHISTGQIGKLVWLTFLVVFGMPWEDSMFTLIYAFNYTWSMPLVTAAVLLFLRDKPTGPVLMFSLGLFSGLWHESNALFLITGCSAAILVRRRLLNRSNIALIAGCCAGFLWIFLAPAWSNRVEFMKTQEAHSLSGIVFSWLYFTFFLYWLICLIRRQFRKYALSPLPVIAVAGGIILVAAVLFTSRARALWPCLLICCCAFVWLGNKTFSLPSTASSVLTVLTAILTTLHLWQVADANRTFNRQHEYILNTWIEAGKRGADTTIFADLTYPWEMGAFTFQRPARHIFKPDDMDLVFIQLRCNRVLLKLVPSQLKEYEDRLGTPLGESGHFKMYKGHIVSSEPSDTAIQIAKADFGLFKEKIQVYTVRFTGADGKEYVFILPYRTIFSTTFGRLKSLEPIYP